MDTVKSLKSSSGRIISLNIPIPPIFSRSFSSLSSPRTPTKSPASSITPPRRSSGGRDGEFREVFRRFDTDNDGRISAYELRAYFGSVGEHMSHEEAEAAIGALDGDGDGLIDFQDFLKLMQSDGGGDGEEDGDLKAAFEMFEFGKGSGRITPKSLQKVLNWLGEPKSYEECVTMIKVYDIDGNGELDFHEFRQMMAA
ncbi:probable calcium-binding protein CML41 [Ipomoea triloba]|uniref:probable calcium-binding protein CML41 n=1 Tax=Ipomoea triloba TaxID=35885 RepID=UPI00125DD7A0|nr:probable calcium-binding protein CML41 [Ipomoea triloba]